MKTFVEAGYTHLIAGTQFPELTRQQLSAGLSMGMSADIYVELSTNSDLAEEMSEALPAIDGLSVGATWVAFEVPPPPGWHAEDWVQTALDAAVNAGLPHVGIYTANWWWSAWIHDSARFAGWPLWYAYYDGVASIDWDSQHFGAWDAPTWKQFVGSTTKLERVADLVAASLGFVPNDLPLVAQEYSGPPNVDLNISE